MKNLLFVLAALLGGCSGNRTFVPSNPLDVELGDPYVLLASDGRYYMYGTGGVRDGFGCYVSDDLTRWEYAGAVYRGNTPESWAVANFWAPEVYERDGITCLVANNAMIQGDIELVPDCRMDDGLLNVIVAETEGAAQLLKPLAFGLVDRTGKAIGRPHLESFAGREITVASSGPVPLEIDGEVVSEGVSSYAARVLPGAVRIVVDALSPYGSAEDGSSRFGGSDVIAYPQ